ncbi:hypothetical protein LINPERPRIM_LOCUS21606 [Linum perenne]
MKLPGGQSMKTRVQFMRQPAGNTTTGSSSSSSSSSSNNIDVGRKTRKGGSAMGYLPKKLVSKLSVQLKHAASIGWHNKNITTTTTSLNYSYDIHSYSLNFDDGRHHH